MGRVVSRAEVDVLFDEGGLWFVPQLKSMLRRHFEAWRKMIEPILVNPREISNRSDEESRAAKQTNTVATHVSSLRKDIIELPWQDTSLSTHVQQRQSTSYNFHSVYICLSWTATWALSLAFSKIRLAVPINPTLGDQYGAIKHHRIRVSSSGT